MPVITVLFSHYLALSMQPGSSAQNPEKLYRERGLCLLVGLLVVLFAITTVMNIPALAALTEQRYIKV